MHRRILGAALAMGALLAGHQATQPQPDHTTNLSQQLRDLANQEAAIEKSLAKPAKLPPDKPTTSVASQRQVTVKARPLAMGLDFTHFVEQSHLRKVKYGKRRWVIV